MKEHIQHVAIRHWAQDDQPREKLLTKGRSSLSDAELLAVLLRSGNRQLSAVQLAQSILKKANFDLNDLAVMSPEELMSFPGMGHAKVSSVLAALELGRRRKKEGSPSRLKMTTSKDVFHAARDIFYDLTHEEFWLFLLNRNNEIMTRKRISQGGVSGTVADNKLIFKFAIEALACSIVILHNHPSGNLHPSKADEALTAKIKQAASNLDIQLLDHLILHNDRYFSFADEGLL